MAEKFYNGVLGQAISSGLPFFNPITFADGSTTTGTFGAATTIPTIASGDFIKISVDPGTVNEEIVYLNGPYTAGATSASTFTRAAEASQGGVSSGVAHAGVSWVHTATAADFGTSGSPQSVTAFEIGVR